MNKPSWFQTFIALLLSISLLACTSMRPIPASDRQAVRTAVKVGDEVSVVATNGKTYLLVLTTVEDDKIVGTGDNKKVTIRYEQIKSIEVRKVSAGKTVGLTAAIIGVTLVALIVLYTIALDNALEEAFGAEN